MSTKELLHDEGEVSSGGPLPPAAAAQLLPRSTSSSSSSSFALHRAVIQRHIQEIERILDQNHHQPAGGVVVDINERDAAGIPPLHYAVHLGYIDVVNLLIRKGADVTRKSAAGWSALQEAIAVRSRVLVKDVMYSLQRKVNVEYERRVPTLLQVLKEMPDFYMELKWEFHSWVPLVSRLCPSDNYKIYKRGANFRVDTTLVGFENMKWSRGSLSFVFTGEQGGGVIYVLDHKDQTVEKIILGEAMADAEVSDKEVNELLSSTTLVKTSPVMDNVVFAPMKTWLGYEKEERIGDGQWNAKVFEFSGFDLRILNRHRVKKTESASPKTREERIKELLDKCGVAPAGKPQGLLFENEAVTERIKTFKGTAWISDEFPRTTQELLPIFELLAPSQKHFQKLNTFISLKMPNSGFPVKVDIPVFPTVSATATFTHHETTHVDAELFVIPPYPPKSHKGKATPSSSSSSSSTPVPKEPVSSGGGSGSLKTEAVEQEEDAGLDNEDMDSDGESE